MHFFDHSTRIISGFGSSSQIPEECRRMQVKRLLFVTDLNLLKMKFVQNILTSLSEDNFLVTVFTDVVPNPRDIDCDRGTEIVKNESIEAIIAVGGGSILDEAKAIGILATNQGICADWDDKPFPNKSLPVICVPTTVGTGSEVTCVAVITNTLSHYKMSLMDPLMMAPTIALLDPQAVADLPPLLLASTAIDALTHAIEAYTSKRRQIITNSLALAAIKLINENLLLAYQNPDILVYREQLLYASTMAGMAFIHSNVGAVHAISETVGGMYDIPHGIANSLFLSATMRYNQESCAELYANIGKILAPLENNHSIDYLSNLAIQQVEKLITKLNIPPLASYVSLTKAEQLEIAEKSNENILSLDNPLTTSVEFYKRIIQDVYFETALN